MITALKPYVVYSFIQLRGAIDHHDIIVPLAEGENLSLALEVFDPYNVSKKTDPVSIGIQAAMKALTDKGWKLSNWHIAFLTGPTVEEKVNTDEHRTETSVNTENSGSTPTPECGQDGNCPSTGMACMCQKG